jgi:DNA primase
VSRVDHARELRLLLDDPRDLCERLGLLGEGRHGRDWARVAGGLLIRCPWHDERTPSCHVWRGEDGTIACFCHGCRHGADAYGLVAVALRLDVKIDFPEVLREAAHIAGVRLEDRRDDWTPRPRPQRPPPVEVARLDDDTFSRIARTIIDACPIEGERDAAEYIDARALLRPAVAAGWSALPADPRALHNLRDRIVAEVGREAWLASGLAVREGERVGSWVYAGHRLVIPWRAPGVDGMVTTLQRRTLGPPPDGVGKYVFTSGRRPEWPYGSDDYAETGTDTPVYFVEGAVDALALRTLLRRAGMPCAVLGLPGVGSWTGETATRWSELARDRHAIIAVDAEVTEGRAAANVAAAIYRMERDLSLAPAARIERMAPYGGHHDWGDCLVAATTSGQAVAS